MATFDLNNLLNILANTMNLHAFSEIYLGKYLMRWVGVY